MFTISRSQNRFLKKQDIYTNNNSYQQRKAGLTSVLSPQSPPCAASPLHHGSLGHRRLRGLVSHRRRFSVVSELSGLPPVYPSRAAA
jgi:hypothetical protein